VAPYHFYAGTASGTGAAQADRFIAEVKAMGYSGKRAGDLPLQRHQADLDRLANR
jgi:lysozyme